MGMNKIISVSMHFLDSSFDEAWKIIVEATRNESDKIKTLAEEMAEDLRNNPGFGFLLKLHKRQRKEVSFPSSYTFFCVNEANNIAVVSDYFSTSYSTVGDILFLSDNSANPIIVIENCIDKFLIYFLYRNEKIAESIIDKDVKYRGFDVKFDSDKLSEMLHIDKAKIDSCYSKGWEETLENFSKLFMIKGNITFQDVLKKKELYQYEERTIKIL
jgi:hypothetical protein